MAIPPRVKRQGWAHGRAERVNLEAIREIIIKQQLKTAAERALTSRLCNEAIDKIMANHGLIFPSREVRTQKHYLGHPVTVTYRAGGSGEGGQGYGTGFPTRAGREDREGLTPVRQRWDLRGPVGRPRKSEPTRSQGRAARLRRERRFDGTPQPAGITSVDCGMLRLSYVDGVTAVELGERFHLRPEVVRKRLSRARQAAKTEGHELPK